MKAIVQDRYGPPDVLELREVDHLPVPAGNEVLVRVRAAAVNASDWHIMRGDPYMARLTLGLGGPGPADRRGSRIDYATNDIGDLLAHNTMAEALFGCVCSVREPDRNFVWRWFTDPTIRQVYSSDERRHHSRTYVADLRASVARRGNDAPSTRLVERLHAVSSEFTALWELHEVAVRRSGSMRVDHPSIGPIELECETLLSPAEDQKLLIFTPPPGTPNIDHLSLLRVLGHDEFTRAAPERR